MIKLACILALVAGASALVCLPNTCATVRCAAVTAENCGGVIKQNGGFCGCCDACIMEIAEGGSCVQTFLFGVPPTSKCADGLYCDPATSTCKQTPAKRELGPCAQRLAEVDARLSSSQHMLLGLERPRCDDQGDYLGMQFAGSQAYCVTKNGTSLNYMVNRWETGDNMDCQCARDQYDYMQTGLIGKMFYCQPNGNYPPTNAPAKKELGACAQRLAEVDARLSSSQHMLLGLERPRCDDQGDYLGMQFAGSQAYCVTKNGTSLNYMVNRWETGDNMDCQCARDQYDYMQTGLIGKLFNCQPNGNYASYKCFGSVCFCVDHLGNQVGTNSVPIGTQDTLNC